MKLHRLVKKTACRFLLFSLLIFIASGCSSDDDNDNLENYTINSSASAGLDGIWEVISEEDSEGIYTFPMEIHIGTYQSFIKVYNNIQDEFVKITEALSSSPWQNGIYKCSELSGSFSVSADTIIDKDGEKAIYSISGDQLTLIWDEDDSVTTLKKVNESEISDAQNDCSLFYEDDDED